MSDGINDKDYGDFYKPKTTIKWMAQKESDVILTVLAILSIFIFLGAFFVFIMCGRKKGWFCKVDKSKTNISEQSSDTSLYSNNQKQSKSSTRDKPAKQSVDRDEKTKNNTLINKTISETNNGIPLNAVWNINPSNLANALQVNTVNSSMQNLSQKHLPPESYGAQQLIQLQLLLSQQKALQDRKLSVLDDKDSKKDSLSRSSNPMDDEDRSKGGRIYKGTRKGGKLKITEEPEVAHFEKDEDNQQEPNKANQN